MKKEKINFDERLIARGGRIWKVSPALRLVLDGHDGLWKLSFEQPDRLGYGWMEASPKFVYEEISAYTFDHFTLARSVLDDRILIVKRRSWRRNSGIGTRDYGYYFAVIDSTTRAIKEVSGGYAAILIRQGAYEVIRQEVTIDETEN